MTISILNTDDERVSVFIPKGHANDDPNFFVSVNGPDTILPKGKTSSVPYEVMMEICRAQAAQEALDDRMQSMMEGNN